MPYALAFLVLPLVLHPATRSTMQGSTRHFQVWVSTNQQIKLGLAQRARSLVPHSREAITFLCQTKAAQVSEIDCSLKIAKKLRRLARGGLTPTEDSREAIAKAAILGKWFARVDSTATIYASLGLMP